MLTLKIKKNKMYKTTYSKTKKMLCKHELKADLVAENSVNLAFNNEKVPGTPFYKQYEYIRDILVSGSDRFLTYSLKSRFFSIVVPDSYRPEMLDHTKNALDRVCNYNDAVTRVDTFFTMTYNHLIKYLWASSLIFVSMQRTETYVAASLKGNEMYRPYSDNYYISEGKKELTRHTVFILSVFVREIKRDALKEHLFYCECLNTINREDEDRRYYTIVLQNLFLIKINNKVPALNCVAFYLAKKQYFDIIGYKPVPELKDFMDAEFNEKTWFMNSLKKEGVDKLEILRQLFPYNEKKLLKEWSCVTVLKKMVDMMNNGIKDVERTEFTKTAKITKFVLTKKKQFELLTTLLELFNEHMMHVFDEKYNESKRKKGLFYKTERNFFIQHVAVTDQSSRELTVTDFEINEACLNLV